MWRQFRRNAIEETEIELLSDTYKVMKGLGSEEFSDVEAAMEREEKLGKVDVLK